MSDEAPRLGKFQRALRDAGALAKRNPARDLARLFGPTLLTQRDDAVLDQLQRDCELIEKTPFQPGEIIAWHYEVQKILRGGFGLVYVCRQVGPEFYERGGSLVALKTPLPRHLGTSELREMFLTEAAHCVALGPHPNLVHAYGVAECNRLPYLVLEYVPDARSLADEIIAGTTDWRTTLRTGLGIARGLDFAGLVHGDLKPQNILLGPDGAAKVADFGLALAPDDPADQMTLAGTRGFLAPEMLSGRPARTVATDVYAFGVVLFASATAHLPFSPGDPAQNVTDPAPDPRDFAAEIPAEFAALILRCLERDPALRPRTFAGIAVELQRLHRALLGTDALPEPMPDLPAKANALVNASQSWIFFGHHAQAEAAARQALALQPENWKAHHALGSVFDSAGDRSAALGCFAEAHEIASDALEPIVSAALAASALGRMDEAKRWLTLAIHRCHAADDFAQLDNCSMLALDLLAEEDAYNLIHRILQDNPRSAITWNNRAILMRRMGSPEHALESAERALALNPAYAKAYVQKANALVMLGRTEECIATAERALALDATLAGAHAAKFSALANLGRFREAGECIERGLSLLPGNELLLRAREKLRTR